MKTVNIHSSKRSAKPQVKLGVINQMSCFPIFESTRMSLSNRNKGLVVGQHDDAMTFRKYLSVLLINSSDGGIAPVNFFGN